MLMVVLALELPRETAVGVGATVGVVAAPPPAAAGVSVAAAPAAAGVSVAAPVAPPAAGVLVAAPVAPPPEGAVVAVSVPPPQALTSSIMMISMTSELYFKGFMESLSSSCTFL